MKHIYTAFALLAFSFNASAEDRACTIEGTLTVMEQRIHSKDCIELNADTDLSILKTMCEGIADAGKHFGGNAGTITYSATCPRPSQGSCANMAQQPMTTYYYAREEDDLPNVAQSCQLMGGTWHAAK